MAKLPKKPKDPKTTASYAVWQNHEKRVAAWKKKCSDIKSEITKKAALIKKVRAAK